MHIQEALTPSQWLPISHTPIEDILDALRYTEREQARLLYGLRATHFLAHNLKFRPLLPACRLAEFNLWTAMTGALAGGAASLDSRLAMDLEVKNSEPNREEDHGSLSQLLQVKEDVEQTINHLSRLALAIRKSGNGSRLHKADTLFNPEQHQTLQKHLEVIILARGTEWGRESYSIDTSSLDPIQERLIRANLRRRNRYVYAQRHAKKLAVDADYRERLLVDNSLRMLLEWRPTPNESSAKDTDTIARMDEPRKDNSQLPASTTVLTATSASKVAQAIEFVPQRASTPSRIAKTNITTTAAKVLYPRPPKQNGSLRYFKCPCCAQALPERYREKLEWICPLCDSTGPPDSPELMDHIAEHIHTFALRSLPWTSPSIGHEEDDKRDLGDNYFDNEDYFDEASDQSFIDDLNDSDQNTDGLVSLESYVDSVASQGSSGSSDIPREDNWIRQAFSSQGRRITIDDTLQKENAIGKLAAEAADEAEQAPQADG
ncbi:DUF2457 domain-containing protein [Colletotrichum sojae]|uniref:DUF2457 domain-containing protein n=1 Tax=Colletotrichum sojae TaxID=2175907 RepID=A0A8H6ISD6_9PEZI|nr:DUF2457 domain-containing protein [Colletotrichum sojae]